MGSRTGADCIDAGVTCGGVGGACAWGRRASVIDPVGLPSGEVRITGASSRDARFGGPQCRSDWGASSQITRRDRCPQSSAEHGAPRPVQLLQGRRLLLRDGIEPRKQVAYLTWAFTGGHALACGPGRENPVLAARRRAVTPSRGNCPMPQAVWRRTGR